MILLQILFCLNVIIINYAEINLYISQEQANKVLGLDGELFYIRNGHVNWMAVKYSLMIPENIDHVLFVWQDKKLNSPTLPTLYSMHLYTSDFHIINSPEITLSEMGKLPVLEEEEFELKITCKEKITGSSTVELHMNLSVDDSETLLELKFSFTKMCMDSSYIEEINKDAIKLVDILVKEREESVEHGDKKGYLYIGAGVACASVIIIAAGVAFLHVHSMPKFDEESKNVLIGSESSIDAQTITQVFRATVAERKQHELLLRLKELMIRRNILTISNAVQEGSFGRVYIGNLVNVECGEDLKVLIKTVTEHATPEDVISFIHESSLLKRTNHPNVLTLMHVCLDDNNIPLMVYPYVNRGNLKNYLRLSRTAEPLAKALTTKDVVLMALQIARGLQYLQKRRFIHKDVATRNCVVDEDLHVKLCDTALSKDFFPGDYHCLNENENRPIRWLATECLETNTYLYASDVWSYGVLLWELSCLAQTPYVNVDPHEMLTYLKSGLRLPQPLHCPDDFFAVMACCWALSPEDRPNITQIIGCLEVFLDTLNAFI
ncbi:tyrosine-protein kinase RYK isoform X2 [Hydra vulgaris]|uniref:Tyrosine-protein kinase RYK isoform X2 n=1 Tax=Hydra vulgaris TaxID=6087 RepID=A0ABM4B5C0_HYDVU